MTSLVIARLDRAPSLPETVVSNREAAAYWIARSSRADSLVVAGGLLAMTKRNFDSNFKQQIHVYILAAGDARGLRVVVPRKQREQEMPDARCTRGPVCKMGKENAHEHTGSAEALRHSLRNGFTAYFALSPENRALLSPSSANSWLIRARSGRLAFRRLDANH